MEAVQSSQASEASLRSPSELAKILASDRPFGDSDYIRGHLQSTYARRLAKIAPAIPAAGELVETLRHVDAATKYRTLGDPLVRCVTQQALSHIVTGQPYTLSLAECADLFRETTRQVEQGVSDGPLQTAIPGAPRLGPEPIHGWIWSEDARDGVVANTFRRLIDANFGGPLASPSHHDCTVLRQAAEILEAVSGPLASSALSHAHLVAIYPHAGRWTKMASGSQFRVSGVVFLAQSMLQSPWWVAEHLLHESLHQKLYDIRHTHSVLLRDTDLDRDRPEGGGGRIVSLWNMLDARGSNRWGISRALAAFHVYVHLAVYARIAEGLAASSRCTLSTPFDPHGLVTAVSAFRRAYYLGTELQERYWSDFGLAGQCLVDWLMQCLQALAPPPAIAPLRVFLLLERYEREAQRIDGLAGGDGIHLELARLRAREVESAAQVLTICNSPHVVGEFASDAVDTAALSETRRRIKSVLSSALADSDSAEVPPIACELVEAMVERSSSQLAGVFSETRADGHQGSPFDERAELLRLTDVIGEGFGTEDWCLFLYSIVRMHAPKTIVELGTGWGTSALWMALAAKRNGLGHVWTVDDFSVAEDYGRLLGRNRSRLRGTLWDSLSASSGEEYLLAIRRLLALEGQLTFVRRRMDLDDPRHFESYPFEDPVDLLFSDFKHGALAILQILGQFLPRMAKASSIFIDGASTSWPSYLLLEQLVRQLNDRTVPAMLASKTAYDLSAVMKDRRIVLVHLTESKQRAQNSTAWLKIEPIDLEPHPRTSIRGLSV